MQTTRLQSRSKPAEGEAMDTETSRENLDGPALAAGRRTSMAARQSRKAKTTGKKRRGKKAANEEVTKTREQAVEGDEKGKSEQVQIGGKRSSPVPQGEEPHPRKRGRGGPRGPKRKEEATVYKEGTIERGHVYFFYRPKVQVEEVESIEDVQRMHMLLVPRPPEWLTSVDAAALTAQGEAVEKSEGTEGEMGVLAPGADVIPAPELVDTATKRYRMITVGKKQLPTAELMEGTGSRKRPVFWATVTAVGDDLESLEKGLGEKTYETKTRGIRHDAPARLAARGAYAIVNQEAPHVPSRRKSHFAYCISHPSPDLFGDVQYELGILPAASFIIQVKNPLAPPIGPRQVPATKNVDYPTELMRAVFGTETGGKGRHNYGLRFASCETPELLDYRGAQLLFIAVREGRGGVEESIGEERGKALAEVEENEEKENVEQIYREIGFHMEAFPAEPLKGEWI